MKIDSTKDNAYTVISLTLWGECRGESYEGKLWVASVIWNRALNYMKNHDCTNIKAVMKYICLQPKQFSCWTSEDEFNQEEPTECQAWDDCFSITTSMFLGRFIPSSTVTHYHATYVTPYWASSLKKIKQVGNHIFYS